MTRCTTISRTVAVILCAALVSLCDAADVGGRGSLQPKQANEAARKTLDSTWWYPWYNPETEGLQRIRTPKEFNWPEWDWGGWNFSWPNLSWTKWLMWAAVAALLILLVYLLVRAWLARDRRPSPSPVSRQSSHSRDQAARVEDLPFALDPQGGNLLQLATHYYELGDYSRAIVFLFSHQLIELDHAHRIRLIRGKTNRQYLNDLKNQSQLRSLLEQTMHAFEEVFFGGHTITQARFEACYRRLPEFAALASHAP